MACAFISVASLDAAREDHYSNETQEAPPSVEKRVDNKERTPAKSFELSDQFKKSWTVKFPRKKVTVLLFANRRSARQGEKWGNALWNRYEDRIAMEGIGVGKSVPKWERSIVRFLIRRVTDVPILLDWDGRVGDDYDFQKEALNLVVVDKEGFIVFKFVGKPTEDNRTAFFNVLDALVKKKVE